MKRTTLGGLGLAIAVMAILAMTGQMGVAESVNGIKDIADFDYVYDFDILSPDQEDRDDNQVPDWFEGGTITHASGLMSYDTAVAGAAWLKSGGLEAGEIWRTAPGIDATNGYSVEASVRINSVVAQDEPACSMSTGVGDTTSYTFGSMTIGADWVKLWHHGTSWELVTTESNVGGFHTFRIAKATGPGDRLFAVYRDGELIIDATYGYNYTVDQLIVGDGSGGNTGGDVDIDYVGFTSGPWAPIPEPTTLVLLVCGAVMMLIRRR